MTFGLGGLPNELLLPLTGDARRPRLAVLVDWLKDAYQVALVNAVDDAARAGGADMLCFAGGILGARRDTGLQRNRLFDLVSPDFVDGLVILTGTLGNEIGPQQLADFCQRFQPRPMVSVAVELPGMPSVLVDNDVGLRLALRHLIEVHGHRTIAFVRGPAANAEAERRFAIYREILHEHGLPYDDRLVALGDFQPGSGVAAVETFYRNRRLRIDAIVAASDAMALGALSGLTGRGVRVPEDIALVGFDDVEDARYAHPPLTTVCQPLHAQGRAAAELVLARIRGERTPDRIVLQTEVVVRRSCGCAHAPQLERVRNPPATLDQALDARMSDIVCATRGARSSIASADLGWPARLASCFVASVHDASTDSFGPEVARMGRDDPASFHPVLDAIRRVTVPWLAAKPDATMRAEDVLHGARLQLAEEAERLQARRRIEVRAWARRLAEMSEALHSTFDLRALMAVLCQRLPELKVPTAFLALYDPADSSRGRLLLAHGSSLPSVIPPSTPDPGRRVHDRDVPSSRFDLTRILPDMAWPDRRGSWVVEPLFTSDESYGYVLLEVGPQDGHIYEALRDQVSGALKGARLVDQVVDEATRREQAERERLTKELEIAARIQTSIIPHTFGVEGFQIAAFMEPTTEVGGDYYDVLRIPGGCVLGIGDVAGHGLRTGLVMLMLQSIVSGLVHAEPQGDLGGWIRVVNAVLYENVRDRLKQDEHTTLTLLRVREDGQVSFVGAHEDIIVYRAQTGQCELVPTPGTWVAARRNIDHASEVSQLQLGSGDMLLLYTDGVTEAANAAGEYFGVERLTETLVELRDRPVEAIRDGLIDAVTRFAVSQDDDMTLLLLRKS